MHNESLNKILSLIAVVVALYFACFHHIERLPINLWDESLFFLRAFHILEQGAYLDNFNLYEYGIDHRNTKLPFTTISQVIGLKLLGLRTLALRLPILVIFITTVFYSMQFFYREFKEYGIAIIMCMVMISSTGFLRDHMLRTGDQDVPFACYILLATFFFYRFELARKTKDLVIFSFWVLAALLTKNLLIGLILPGLVVYLVYRSTLLELLIDKRTYLALIGLLSIYAGLIFYYEMKFPGFFDRMWNYELLGRYTNTIDGHGNKMSYFIETMGKKDFFPFMLLIPPAMIALMRMTCYKRFRPFIALISSVFICYLLGISISSTKVFWYSAPLYPLGAVILACLAFPETDSQASGLIRRLPLLVFLIILLPYGYAMKAINNPKTIYQSSKFGAFIKDLAKDKPNLKQFTFFDDSFGTGAGFYLEQANSQGYYISYKRKVNFQVQDHIALCRHKLVPLIKEKHQIEKVFANPHCVIYQITR